MVNAKQQYPDVYRESMWYRQHQDELSAQYNGKYLLISGRQVCGAYDTQMEAYVAGLAKYSPGKFAVHPCMPRSEEKEIRISTPLFSL